MMEISAGIVYQGIRCLVVVVLLIVVQGSMRMMLINFVVHVMIVVRSALGNILKTAPSARQQVHRYFCT